jgi:hypothetical protein
MEKAMTSYPRKQKAMMSPLRVRVDVNKDSIARMELKTEYNFEAILGRRIYCSEGEIQYLARQVYEELGYHIFGGVLKKVRLLDYAISDQDYQEIRNKLNDLYKEITP